MLPIFLQGQHCQSIPSAVSNPYPMNMINVITIVPFFRSRQRDILFMPVFPNLYCSNLRQPYNSSSVTSRACLSPAVRISPGVKPLFEKMKYRRTANPGTSEAFSISRTRICSSAGVL